MPQLQTIRSVVSQASLEIGITLRPVTSVVGSLDQDIVQMTALLFAVANELLLEEPYRVTLGDGVWLMDAAGEPLLFPQHDTDRILFDGRLIVDGLKFQFLAAKGLEYGEAARAFTSRLNKLAGIVNGRVIDLDVDEGRVI